MVRVLRLLLAGFLAVACLLSWPEPSCEGTPEAAQVAPTVAGAFPDGISLEVPTGLGNARLAALGLVDVTAEPFRADPSGQQDSTRAIQQAVNFARDHQMVCFFPSGTYRVSDTISCVQNLYRRSSGQVLNARNHPCVLLGSRLGPRPAIVLAPGSPGFQDPARPRPVVDFQARDPANPAGFIDNVCMNQMLVNLDVRAGAGNPGAVGIRLAGAQGSGVQECTVTLADGFAGIEGGAGSGGLHAAVTVVGGEYGLDLRKSEPAATVVGATLIGQRRRAILYSGQQTLTAVGIRILCRSGVTAVENFPVSWGPNNGRLSMVDSSIEFEGPPGRAFFAGTGLYLNNVFVRNAAEVVGSPAGRLLAGGAPDWIHVAEFARAQNPPRWKGYQFTAPVVADGKRSPGLLRLGPPAPPPPDLQTRHLWPGILPGFETPGTANVQDPPYRATGDGRTDDTAALQRAIDENRVVFLPKGCYRTSAPLVLRPDTQLVGVASHLSVILARPGATAFAQPRSPAPLVQTAGDEAAATTLAFLWLFAPREVPGSFALDWRCGGDSVLRGLNLHTSPPLAGYAAETAPPAVRNTPLVTVSGRGGGRWYGFYQEGMYFQGPDYRHLRIADATGPLRIYQCNPEHSRGEANLEIVASRGVDIYGLKGEGNRPILRMRDSNKVRVFGYGGNAAAYEGRALIEMEDCSDVLLANLADSPRLAGQGSEEHSAGRGVDPEQWRMVSVAGPVGARLGTLPLERPVAFVLGSSKAGGGTP
ncbi:MAG: glycosyl hydrolase family 28-related protein [Thermodesulfobacteriota bacterium]